MSHAAPSDRRSGMRARRLFKVAFLLDGAQVTATVTDISPTGAFLHSRQLPAVGTTVEFAVKSVKLNLPVVMVTGEVVRVIQQPSAPGEVRGFGVQWKSMMSPAGPSAVAELFQQMCGEPMAPSIPSTQEPTSLEYRFDTNQFEVRDVTKPEFQIDHGFLNGNPADAAEGTPEEGVDGEPEAVAPEDAPEVFGVRLPALVTHSGEQLPGLVTRLGRTWLAVRTQSRPLPVASMITVKVEPPAASWARMPGIHMMGRVVSSRPASEGGEADVRLSRVDEHGVIGAFELLLDDARNGSLG